MPLLNWWALESHCESNPGDVMQIFEAADIWGSRLVREHILERLMRRFAATNRRQDYLRCARLLQLAPDASSKSRLLKGIEAAWSGRIPSGIPDELADAMSAAGGGSLRLRVRQKHAQALVEALEVVADPQADPLERTDLITLLGEANHEPVVDGLLGIIANDDEDERVVAAAITSLGSFDSEKVPGLAGKSAPKGGTDSTCKSYTLGRTTD
jgi:hypothetical protein